MLIEFHRPTKFLKLSPHRCNQHMPASNADMGMPGIKLPIHQMSPFVGCLCLSSMVSSQINREEASKSDATQEVYLRGERGASAESCNFCSAFLWSGGSTGANERSARASVQQLYEWLCQWLSLIIESSMNLSTE